MKDIHKILYINMSEKKRNMTRISENKKKRIERKI